MNERELNNQVEANEFADDLSDEALDRTVALSSVPTYGCNYCY